MTPVKSKGMMMIQLMFLFLFGGPPLAPAAPPSGGYVLAFEDNFTGPSLDTSAWNYRTGGRLDGYNLQQNVVLTNGMLQLHGKQETYTESNGTVWNYTNGGIITKETFRYGYYECRARLTSKDGWHSSFWQFGNSDAGTTRCNEIDGFEVKSSDPAELRLNTHNYLPTRISEGAHVYTMPTGTTYSDFHTYGWEWTPYEVIWYLDGTEIYRRPYAGPHQFQEVWLTTLAEDSGEGIDGGAVIEFDYFRYYAHDYDVPSGGTTVSQQDATETGTWFTSGAAQNNTGAWTTRRSNTEGDSATWTPNLWYEGNHEIMVWNPAYLVNTTDEATYEIKTGDGTSSWAYLDQRFCGQNWVSLGSYFLKNNGSAALTLHVDNVATEKHHRYDAAMFRPFNLCDENFDDSIANNWTIQSGTWSLIIHDSGKAWQNTGTSTSLATFTTTSWQNYFVRASVKPGDGAWAGIIGRYMNDSNYYLLRIAEKDTTDQLQLLKQVDGTWTALKTINLVGEYKDTWHDLMLFMEDDLIVGMLNGIPRISLEDDSISAGTVGLRTWGGQAAYDNIGAGH